MSDEELRAVVGSIEQNGIRYMTVEYDYQLEKSDVRVAGVDSVQLPFDNAPSWTAVDHEDAAWLAQLGVPAPDLGSRQ